MRFESAKTGAIRALLLVDEADDHWRDYVAEALGMAVHDLGSADRIDSKWRNEWGSVENALLMGSPNLPLNGLAALIWHRPDGGPALVDPSPSPNATKMVRFALRAVLIAALRDENLVPYVKQGFPHNWRSTRTFWRGDPVDHLVWADAITGQADVWDRRGQMKEPGVLPVLRLSGNIVIEPGEKDLGFV